MSNNFYCRGDWLRIVKEEHEDVLVSMARIENETGGRNVKCKNGTLENAY